MLRVPDTLLPVIASFLPFKDILSGLRPVCRRTAAVTCSDSFWKPIFLERYWIVPDDFPAAMVESWYAEVPEVQLRCVEQYLDGKQENLAALQVGFDLVLI